MKVLRIICMCFGIYLALSIALFGPIMYMAVIVNEKIFHNRGGDVTECVVFAITAPNWVIVYFSEPYFNYARWWMAQADPSEGAARQSDWTDWANQKMGIMKK